VPAYLGKLFLFFRSLRVQVKASVEVRYFSGEIFPFFDNEIGRLFCVFSVNFINSANFAKLSISKK